MDAVHAGKIRGMYIMGENPAMSDPDVSHAARHSPLEMLVVRTSSLRKPGIADVICRRRPFRKKTGTFTNTDRSVRLGRQNWTHRVRRARTC
jgi:formate dehydrogenase major subunit